MKASTFTIAAGLAVQAVILSSGSASAADWQALRGVQAAPMHAADMQAVQGKTLLMSDVFKSLGSTNSVSLANGSKITYWASTPGTRIGYTASISASTPVSYSGTLTYSPAK